MGAVSLSTIFVVTVHNYISSVNVVILTANEYEIFSLLGIQGKRYGRILKETKIWTFNENSSSFKNLSKF